MNEITIFALVSMRVLLLRALRSRSAQQPNEGSRGSGSCCSADDLPCSTAASDNSNGAAGAGLRRGAEHFGRVPNAEGDPTGCPNLLPNWWTQS